MSETLDLHIGPKQRLFQVNRALLWDKAPYFKSTSCTRFPDLDEEAFQLFLTWLDEDSLPSLEYVPQHAEHFARLNCWTWNPFELYEIAEMFQANQLMDRVMDSLLDAMKQHSHEDDLYPSIDTIAVMYSFSPANSTLRAFTADYFAYKLITGKESAIDSGDSWTISAIHQILSGDDKLLLEAIKSVYGAVGKDLDSPLEKDPCHWLVHKRHGVHAKCPVAVEKERLRVKKILAEIEAMYSCTPLPFCQD